MTSDFAGATHTGQVRDRNEDSLLLRPARGLFVVADGMGGHAGGDIASRMAVDIIDEAAAQPDNHVAGRLEAGIRAAHEAILRAARADPALSGMGTTVTALQIRTDGSGCSIAHVGDSRAYRLRGEAMEQLTRDQTWVQDQIDAGILSPEQARHHRYSSVLTGALGSEDGPLMVEVTEPDCRPGDTFLLCTDGLLARLEDHDIRRIITAHQDLQGAAQALVDAANQAGGPDNITVALIRLG
jgi:PPM family protein phosphatase